MTSSRDNLEQNLPGCPEPVPQRPRTLLQRVSSGFLAMMPKLRKGRSKPNLNDRPNTAPDPPRRLTFENMRDRLRLPSRPQLGIPQIDIPQLSQADGDCPYDASTYFSFPSIETPTCNICGLRSIPKTASNIPCIECRSRSPFSHIASAFRRTGGQSRSNSAVQTSTTQLIDSASSSENGPRIVPPALAATRIGNPPRRVSLPRGQVPSYNTLHPSSAQRVSRSSKTNSRGSNPHDARPISPKLHHLYGLPHAKDYPYVHKREVEAHLLALRAGSPSSLLRHIDEVNSSTDPREPYPDYSRTVFYGQSYAPNPPRRSAQPGTTIMQRIEASGSIIIEEGRRGGLPITVIEELENSRVYRRHTPQTSNQQGHRHSRTHDTDSLGTFSTLTTQSPSTVGGMRLELKGGNGRPRLRGGCIHAGLGFGFKEWLLTCPSLSRINPKCPHDSEDDLPPPRISRPTRTARAYERAHGNSHLPSNISRGNAPPNLSVTNTLPPPAAERSARAPGTHHSVQHTHSAPSHISTCIRAHSPSPRFCSTVTQLCPRTAQQPLTPPVSTSTPPIPSLRGGAGSASWADSDRLPPKLYWLAGGRGRPITVGSWKQQRGKTRMGGILGMVVSGARAGMEYEKDKHVSDTASVEGGAGSVKSGKSSSKRGRSTATSSRSSGRTRMRSNGSGLDTGSRGSSSRISRSSSATSVPAAVAVVRDRTTTPASNGGIAEEAALPEPVDEVGQTPEPVAEDAVTEETGENENRHENASAEGGEGART